MIDAKTFSRIWLVGLAALGIALLLALSMGCERRARSSPISIGATVQGALERGDWTDVFADGSYTDLYELELRAGHRVTIELQSNDFDTYLSVMRGPGDQLVDNDDVAPDDTDSRVVFTSPADGRYFVAATTFRTGAGGAYSLTVREGGEEEDPPPSAPAGADTKAR